MFIGCEVKQIGIKHATLGSAYLYPKAGENSQIEPGGLKTDSEPEGITASGEPIYKSKVSRWVVESAPIAWKRSTNDTLKFIRDLSASFEEADFTFELADGMIYAGKGKIVGDLKGATLDATIPLKFEGGGGLDKI